MSLFQSQYWVATNYSQKVEMIMNFLFMGAETLVVIDMKQSDDVKSAIEYIREKGHSGFLVELITPAHRYLYENGSDKKTIYVFSSINTALDVLRQVKPILGIFA